MSKKSVFLTGFTGSLGREIVRHLLANTDDRIFLLIRRKQRYSHWDRARKILAGFGLDSALGTRVEVFEGDVSLPGFGLDTEEISQLRREVSEFYHAAALTALNGSEQDCCETNVKGTENALELACDFQGRGVLSRFFYYSTAYVAGSLQTFCAPEDSLPERPAHANYYESSKYAAEKKVRAAMQAGLPATIFRPSIVVGDSKTGEVAEFNVIYPFMRLFAHGMLTTLPTRLDNSFNIVPIDYVIKASLAISRQKDSAGRTFHLVTKDPPTIGMLLKLREEYSNVPEIEIIPPETFNRDHLDFFEQSVFQMLSPYLGYLNGDLTFDTRNTDRALEGTGISAPKTDYEFLKTLCRYAVDAGYLILEESH